MDLAALVFDWTVRETNVQDHMSQHGPVFENTHRCFLLSLKQEYATVFQNQMSSPLVKSARQAGYQPLFVIKNAVIVCRKIYVE